MLADWAVNVGNPKGRFCLFFFRFVSAFSGAHWSVKLLALPFAVIYRVVVEWVLGVELPWKLKVGPGLRLFHGQALVVNDRVVIGKNCVLRHCTTIGVATTDSGFGGAAPVIGDDVDIGSNVVILGDIRIGNGAVIGAGSVVVKDVPEGAVVVGNPARVIRVLPYSPSRLS